MCYVHPCPMMGPTILGQGELLSHHLVHVQTTCQAIISHIGSVSAWLHEVSFLGVCKKKKALWLNTEFMCLHVIACKLYNQFLYTLPDSTFKAFSLKQNYYWYGPTYELFSSSSVRPSVWFMAELFGYLSGCAVQITCVLLHWTRLCLEWLHPSPFLGLFPM